MKLICIFILALAITSGFRLTFSITSLLVLGKATEA